MSLIRIAWRNILNKPLNTLLTLVLLAFGVGIISLLLQIEVQLRSQFDRNIRDIDMVLGAKGSPLQLILANVYHVDAPTGNINLEEANKVLNNRFLKLYIEEAIPLAYGDYLQNFRIVGTEHSYPAHYDMKLSDGRLFLAPYEATIGSKVAEQTGLKVGDKFISTHGLDKKSEEENATADPDVHSHADQPYTVVGIFEKSNSVIDQLALTQVQSIWMIHEGHDHGAEGEEHEHTEEEAHQHDEHAGEATAEEHDHEGHDHSKEVTAYLLKERESENKADGEHKASQLQRMVPNLLKDTNIQAAQPAIEINRLSEGFGLGLNAATVIAIIIMTISFISVFVSLYNSLKDRKYELALMRTMGGTRGTLFRLITLEGLLMTVLGFVLGIVLSRMALFILSRTLEDKFNYSMSSFAPLNSEYVLLGITLLVGIVASLLPALRALWIDISKTLSNG